MQNQKPENIISVNRLTKRFGKFTAVDGVSFTVRKGEIFAFLGPNGAGKSTTIKMLITLISPTSGDALIDGHNIIKNPGDVRKSIGYVPQMLSVDGTLSAYENLTLMAKLYDLRGSERKKRVSEIISFMKLDEHLHSPVNTFSGGMIRKLEIGQAMLHHPPVIFLDEPTTGLDPVARRTVWKHLLELREKYGTTIFFSTHYMEEAEEVATRVAIMHQKKIAAIGTANELKLQSGVKNATLEDAFIHFTGAAMQEGGTFTDVKLARDIARRRG